MHGADCIVINGLEFYAYHGVSDQEQQVGHRFLVDVRLTADTQRSYVSDQLSDTVNYDSVARRIVQVGTQERFRLLEALAQRLATVILAEFPLVHEVGLRVLKLCPPIDAAASSVGVEIHRTR